MCSSTVNQTNDYNCEENKFHLPTNSYIYDVVDVEFSQSMKKRALNPNVGAWVGIGAGIGAALYAATQEPVWIAVGVALGAALGISRTDKNEEG